jgi:hypothetical protein
LDNLAPSQTRLVLAQANAGSSSAVASQAVASQPEAPQRSDESIPPRPADLQPSAAPPSDETVQLVFDPRLDPNRPQGCQLDIASEQTLSSGAITIVLPAGTYEQKILVENPEGKRAIGETGLKPQQIGLGYIRYLAEVPLKIDGVTRSGGVDVPIRKTDNLPVRIWYRKMEEPDDLTKMFSFILPPVALVSGLGAWSSGNVIIPDAPPVFTEARNYYLKPPPAKKNLDQIPQPSHVRPLMNPYATGSSQIRSK